VATSVLADWRRPTSDSRIDFVPTHLRNKLASTAERVAVTFELGARIRERIAAGNGPEADYYRLRAAWNRTVADFERRQAAALRSGHLLAVPWARATAPPTATTPPDPATALTRAVSVEGRLAWRNRIRSGS
jgi:hypothetical protein